MLHDDTVHFDTLGLKVLATVGWLTDIGSAPVEYWSGEERGDDGKARTLTVG
jgi:hypothetical protein